MKEIKNRDEIVAELTNMLMQFEKSCDEFQTDVYLYYDEATGNARLHDFIDIGGNSWLDDDHYTIYKNMPKHFDVIREGYHSIEEIANCLDRTAEDLIQETIDSSEWYDDKEDIDFSAVAEYVKGVPEYEKQLTDIFFEYVDDMKDEYFERADELINEFEFSDEA